MGAQNVDTLLTKLKKSSLFAECAVIFILLIYSCCTIPNLILIIDKAWHNSPQLSIIEIYGIGLQSIATLGTCVVCYLLIGFLRSVRLGYSPFTCRQVRKFQVIAACLYIVFIIKVFASQSFLPYAHIGSFYLSVIGASGDPSVLDINLSYVLWASVALFMSRILRYGVELQSLSDDTV